MKLYIPIAGTWARKRNRNDDWFRSASSLDALLNDLGYARVDQNNDPNRPDPGFWSGDVGGLLIQQLAPWWSHDEVWREGADDLVQFLRDREGQLSRCEEVALIAHSHGGQVVSFALQTMRRRHEDSPVLPKLRVVTVDMPVRIGKFLGIFPRGMDAVYQDALSVVSNWIHLYSGRGWKSKMRWLGNRFGPRKLKGAFRNCRIPGAHSGILSESRWFYVWQHIMSGDCPPLSGRQRRRQGFTTARRRSTGTRAPKRRKA